MGAWGHGPFDNDGALDLIGEIRDGDFTFDSVEWAFDDPDYLEVDGGQIAVALAALVRISRRDADAPETDIGPSDLEGFSAQLDPERLAWLQKQLDRALSNAEASELYELWEESGEVDDWLKASRVRISPTP